MYGTILKIKNILNTFDEFENKEILTDRDWQDYQSEYLRLYDIWRNKENKEKENINDDIVFEIELIKQVEINIDYILMLIKKYSKEANDKEIIITIQKAIDSSIELRSKKDLIMNFINSLTPDKDIDENLEEYINKQKDIELDKIISEENLNKEETYNFIKNVFRDGFVPTNGTTINNIMPPVSFFTENNDREKKRASVLDKIKSFFERFKDIVTGLFEE